MKTDGVKQIVLCEYDGNCREIYFLKASKVTVINCCRNGFGMKGKWISVLPHSSSGFALPCWSSQVQPPKTLLLSWQWAHIWFSVVCAHTCSKKKKKKTVLVKNTLCHKPSFLVYPKYHWKIAESQVQHFK